jgi:membrane associated rhomboid family serine protease
MLGSSNQSRVDGPFERFSAPFRDLVDHFGSVVKLLIIANIVVFFVQLLANGANFPYLQQYLALSTEGIRRGFVWQFVTYMFLHATIWHILGNMLILWFLGTEVEYFLGPKYFTRLYFMSGIFGGGLWLAFNFTPLLFHHYPIYASCIGASAAVLGCVVAYATLFPDREVAFLLFFILPINLRAKYLAMIAVGIDVAMLLMGGSGVANLAHLGGAAFGYVYIKQLGYGTTPKWLLWFQDITARLRPRPGSAPRNMSSDEFVREQVDPILDKIAREGLQSLTRRERKILESAKDLMQKRQR